MDMIEQCRTVGCRVATCLHGTASGKARMVDIRTSRITRNNFV